MLDSEARPSCAFDVEPRHACQADGNQRSATSSFHAMARSSLNQFLVRDRTAAKVTRHFLAFGLALSVAMTSASCLITSDPEFSDPQRTPPFLIVDKAQPSPLDIVILQATDIEKEFLAVVRSEDAGDPDPLEVKLALDYG